MIENAKQGINTWQADTLSCFLEYFFGVEGGHDRKRREREPEVLGFSEQLQEKSKMNLAF